MASIQTPEVLDVRQMIPSLKHPAIFQKFDDLTAGESLIIYNDHDPKPLYYQLLAARGQVFSWTYRREGPERWEVEIKRLKEEESPTIGELVARDYRRAQVFKKWGIDFCCGGKKTLAQACASKGLDQQMLEGELQALESDSHNKALNYNSWELDFMADFIENTHHSFVRNALPVLREYTSKIARVHGERHPELRQISGIFEDIAAELLAHMEKEEKVLFPYVRNMCRIKKGQARREFPPFGSIENPIRCMEQEHEEAGEGLAKIRRLSQEYTLPADACATLRVTYQALQDFEADLHQHIHLENNLLFPKAKQLEEALLGEA